MSLPVLSVVCIGGATVDRTVRALRNLVPGTSNPVSGLPPSFGGVARNVAETLARLAVPTGLISAIGADGAGRALADHLGSHGVKTDLTVDDRFATAEYLAVLQPSGDLAFGLATMAILDALSPDIIDGAWALLSEASWVFVDCNLPQEVLARLLARRPEGSFRLAVDPVSTVKATRLPPDLSGIDLLFANRDEACVLAGEPSFDARPERLLPSLAERGVRRLVLTLGADGALVVEAGKLVAKLQTSPTKVVDVTGAGDALIAGTLFGMVRGAHLVGAVEIGLICASLTLEGHGSVRSDLSPDLLREAGARIQGPHQV